VNQSISFDQMIAFSFYKLRAKTLNCNQYFVIEFVDNLSTFNLKKKTYFLSADRLL